MPRPLDLEIEIEDDTTDRRALRRWKGERRLQDIGESVGRSKQFVSKWLKHQAELRDEEIEQWVTATGISRRTFLEGRFESRNRFSSLVRDAAA
jgi:hypothetical protein